MALRERPGVAVTPAFLQLAGHAVRWRLLSELARSDRRVRELAALVEEPQSLVSYHLGRLRADDVGLVTTHRSSADGRDTYYRLDLARCAELLTAAGAALHPAVVAPGASPPATARRGRRPRVLFLCTGNSARSQLAEGLVRHLSHGTVLAFSAGSAPKPIHPHALRVGHEHGIDLTGRRAKHLSRFVHQRFDYVITLCDRVREVCPDFPGATDTIHWSVPDPSRAPGTDDDTYPAFQHVATELEHRIRYWLLTVPTLTRGGEPA